MTTDSSPGDSRLVNEQGVGVEERPSPTLPYCSTVTLSAVVVSAPGQFVSWSGLAAVACRCGRTISFTHLLAPKVELG